MLSRLTGFLRDINRGIAAHNQQLATNEVTFGNLAPSEVDRAKISVLLADTAVLESRAAYFGDWSEFVAVTGEDPVLNNLPARYVRAKK